MIPTSQNTPCSRKGKYFLEKIRMLLWGIYTNVPPRRYAPNLSSKVNNKHVTINNISMNQSRLLDVMNSIIYIRLEYDYDGRNKVQQVAQLWQRDRTTLVSFSINFHLYSQNHKIAFLSHPMGHQ